MTSQGQRLKCAELHKSSIELYNELANDLTKIFEHSDKNVTPFMSLFILATEEKAFSK